MSKTAQMSEELYRQIDAVSSTDLKKLHESPRRLWLSKQVREPSSPEMEFGTCFHMAILETERFRELYTCEPDRMPDGKIAGIGPKETHVNRNTTAWKEFIAFWKSENAHRKHVHPDDFSLLIKMVNAVAKNEFLMGLIANSDKEVATLWTDKRTGQKCKGKADLAGQDLVDFKTTACRTPKDFERDAWYRLVHMQMGFYDMGFETNGIKFRDHYVVALRKDYESSEIEPWIFKYDSRLIERGRSEANRLMDKFLSCKEKDIWPGLGDQVMQMSVPSWAIVGDET